MGSPVTGVQLSPSQDLLATCHVKRRGIYLWYNHLMFGSGADIQPSTRPVNASLPSIATGESFCDWLLGRNHLVIIRHVPPFTCSGTVITPVGCRDVVSCLCCNMQSCQGSAQHQDAALLQRWRSVSCSTCLHATAGLRSKSGTSCNTGSVIPMLLFALHGSGDQEQRVQSQDSDGTAQSFSPEPDVVIAQATQNLICPMGDT